MKKSTLILGYLAAFFMAAGTIFKIMHWPGSGVSLTLGCIMLPFAYGIPLFIEKNKFAENSFQKFFNLWVLILMFLSIPVLFKIMHWPGGAIGFIVFKITLIVSIPIVIIHALKTKDILKNMNFHNEAIMFILLSSFLIFTFSTMISKDVLNAFVFLHDPVIKEMKFQESKSNELYTTLENAVNTGNADKTYLEKAKEIKNASDSLCGYILTIENLMTTTTGQEKCNFDSLTVLSMGNKEASAKVMVIDNKGEELKQKINKYKAMVAQSTNSKGKEIISLFFNTEDPKPLEGEIGTWVYEKFVDLPLVAVLFELNQMRSNIRQLEAETMTYLQVMAAKSISAEAVHNEDNTIEKN